METTKDKLIKWLTLNGAVPFGTIEMKYRAKLLGVPYTVACVADGVLSDCCDNCGEPICESEEYCRAALRCDICDSDNGHCHPDCGRL